MMKDGKLRISREEGRRNGLACCDNPERSCLNDPDRCAVDSALSIRQKDRIVKFIERTFVLGASPPKAAVLKGSLPAG